MFEVKKSLIYILYLPFVISIAKHSWFEKCCFQLWKVFDFPSTYLQLQVDVFLITDRDSPLTKFFSLTNTSAPKTHVSSTRYPFEASLKTSSGMNLSKPHSSFRPWNRHSFPMASGTRKMTELILRKLKIFLFATSKW